jgi:quinol monooxygenase YgiN
MPQPKMILLRKAVLMSIRVVADFHVLAGTASDFLEAVRELQTETHAKDAGCIFYELFRNTADPLQLSFIEEWESQEALDAHMATEHFNRLLPKMNAALDPAKETAIKIYEAAL